MSLLELDRKMQQVNQLTAKLPDRIINLARLEECYLLAFQLNALFKDMWRTARSLSPQSNPAQGNQELMSQIQTEFNNCMHTIASLLIGVLVNVGNESPLFQKVMSDLDENRDVLRLIKNPEHTEAELLGAHLALFKVANKRGKELALKAFANSFAEEDEATV